MHYVKSEAKMVEVDGKIRVVTTQPSPSPLPELVKVDGKIRVVTTTFGLFPLKIHPEMKDFRLKVCSKRKKVISLHPKT